MQIRIAGAKPNALTDGPGRRFSIYVQGCSVRCTGCQVSRLWNPSGGRAVDVRELACEALASRLPVSMLGGEPLDQAEGVAQLLAMLRAGACPNIILYSGRTFEELIERSARHPAILAAFSLADVLVDGPFVEELDHDRLQYRGSSNQRVIDLRATIRNVLRDPVLLDWDMPEILITPGGDLLAAEGLAAEFATLGASVPARRCGEVPA